QWHKYRETVQVYPNQRRHRYVLQAVFHSLSQQFCPQLQLQCRNEIFQSYYSRLPEQERTYFHALETAHFSMQCPVSLYFHSLLLPKEQQMKKIKKSQKKLNCDHMK